MSHSPALRPVAEGVFESAPKIVRLPDGTLMASAYSYDEPAEERAIRVRYSRDHGVTWSEPRTLFRCEETHSRTVITEALVDHDGEVHLFLLDQWQSDARGEGERGGAGTYKGYRIDIWHVRSEHGRRDWRKPRCIWEGYTGALNSSLQLKGGRILLPFSYYVNRTWSNRGNGLAAFTFMGMFTSTVLYSDDGGATWALSNDMNVVTPDITYAYGACEPVAIERLDGSVWMLIRSQMGRFYESFSPDGATWSRPTPSPIVSSDSPAGLVRLDDGRMVLVWNHCLRHPYAYGGRQVIHAALSLDDGKTWRGYREVGRDPRRNEPPPTSGDHGTAYPFPVATAENTVLISTGQGRGRVLVQRLDPAYLEEKRHVADLGDGLDEWAIFGTRGVDALPHPEGRGPRALRIRRADPEFPAAAVWNFPAGRKGVLKLRLLLEEGSRGVAIGLTDHFSPPFDDEDRFHNVVNVLVTAGSSSPHVEPGRWHDIEVRWDCDRGRCRIRLDGRPAGSLRPARETPGIGYLRLRALADAPEGGACLLTAVEAEVS